MGRSGVGWLALGVAGVAALTACGDGEESADRSAPVAVAADTAPTTSADAAPTTQAIAEGTDTTAAAGTVIVETEGGDGTWMSSPYAATSDYVGPPLEERLSRTTDSGIVVHAYAWPTGGWTGPAAGGGWAPASWCAPTGSLRVTMRLGEAVGIGTVPTNAEPFGGIGVQALVGGYAEASPFTVLVVQATDDVDSVEATFADGTVDAADVQDGLAVLAAPTAPPHEEMMWTGDAPPAGPAFTLRMHRGAEVTEIPSLDLPFPGPEDYERDCEPPQALPAPGEQPADPTAAEQEIRDTFGVVFDIPRREGDRSWLALLDSDEGVEAAIETVLAGSFGSAAKSAEYTMGDLVFTSPTEAWFFYDLFANGSNFGGRFGLAVQVDGAWKISRGVICQDLALAGAQCDPPIGPLYPSTD